MPIRGAGSASSAEYVVELCTWMGALKVLRCRSAAPAVHVCAPRSARNVEQVLQCRLCMCIPHTWSSCLLTPLTNQVYEYLDVVDNRYHGIRSLTVLVSNETSASTKNKIGELCSSSSEAAPETALEKVKFALVLDLTATLIIAGIHFVGPSLT